MQIRVLETIRDYLTTIYNSVSGLAYRFGYGTLNAKPIGEYITVSIAGGTADTVFKTIPAGKRWIVTAIAGTPPASITVSDIKIDENGIGTYLAPSTYFERKLVEWFGTGVPCDTSIKVSCTNSGGAANLSLYIYGWEVDE